MHLAPIFQDHMILQRGKPVPVWGSAQPDAKVTVSIQGMDATARADGRGDWNVLVGPLKEQDTGTLTVTAGEETVTVHDVAVGDVYLAGGQSNMEFLMRYEKFAAEEREQCENPLIRFYDVPEVAYDGQEQDFDYSKVGLWRKATPDDLDYFSAPGYYFAKKLQRELGIPVGIIGVNWGGSRSSAWMTEAHAREICPEQVADFEAKLGDETCEQFIASAGNNPMNDRGYSSWSPFDEFILPQTPTMQEIGAFFSQMVGAAGSVDFSSYASMPDVKHYPGCLYEHMVKKVAPFGVKGALWYQGESDDELPGSAAHYAASLKTVIADWRALWNEPALPFLVVQLPGFRSWLACVNQDYPLIRAAQQQVADEDENVFLCSISDLGEELDIHPKNKRDVGFRLAGLALQHIYGKDLLADAPRPGSVNRNGSQIRICFFNAGKGLALNGDAIEALEVSAGEDAVPFDFAISGDSLLLTAKEHREDPLAVRLARGDWYRVNLYNSGGIPAIPFELQC